MRKTAIIVFILVAAAAAWWFGRPIYREQKEARFAAGAREALAHNEYRKALLSAQQTLLLNSNNVTACQVMATLAELSRSPHAIIWRRRVAELNPTVENKLALAATALQFEPPPFSIAAQTLEKVSLEASNTVGYQLVSAQLALKQNRTADAEKCFERARDIEPTNELHRLNLAMVRSESKDASIAAAAHAELERMQTDPRWGANAARALIAHHLARRQFVEAQQYSAQLLATTNASFSDKLQHLTILRGAKDPSFDSTLVSMQREAGTNAVYVGDLMARMTALGLGSDALAWSETFPSSLRKGMPVAMVIADTYGTTRHWRELEQFLTDQQWQERDYLRQALLALALRNQNVNDVATVHWNDAVQKASDRPELMLNLAQLASNWGWTNEIESLLWRAAREFPKERWPIESLQNNYARLRNTRALLETTALMLEQQPSNPVPQNNWAALALLLNTNLAKAHQLARQVYDRDTNNFAYVSTYAWSLHKQGKTTEALKLMETIDPRELANPSVASYYGAMLAAAGKTEKAREYLAKAEAGRILPEELNLVAEARKRL
jgi:predicted Zn-dependent protease